jgi:hypothetical protein
MSNKIEKALSTSDLEKLRRAGILQAEEVALLVGDVVVAENVVDKKRRILEVGNLLLESTRRILRD